MRRRILRPHRTLEVWFVYNYYNLLFRTITVRVWPGMRLTGSVQEVSESRTSIFRITRATVFCKPNYRACSLSSSPDHRHVQLSFLSDFLPDKIDRPSWSYIAPDRLPRTPLALTTKTIYLLVTFRHNQTIFPKYFYCQCFLK